MHGVAAASATSARARRIARVGLASLAEPPGARALGRRAAAARARARLVAAPALIFLDEPTASLDPAPRREIERVIGEIHASGTAIVFTTHHPRPRAPRRRRDLFLHEGRSTEQTPADRFFIAPHRRGGRLPQGRIAMEHRLKLLSIAALMLLATAARAQDFITVASTTSTEQSGLFRHLLPEAKKALGFDVRVVAVGTGQALDMARRGDADVVLVHDKAAEEKFVAEGFGVKRYEVMYNDFVLVGPKGDPAKTRGHDVVAALRKIAATKSPFVSRADKSGTHSAELRYWKLAGIDRPKGEWYRETGSGMGPTLNTAAGMNAYALDRPRHVAVVQEPRDLVVLVEGDRSSSTSTA
jgi:tungstate transport system substrate-binding protein